MKALSIILSIIFIVSGSAKLLGLDFEIKAFNRWGYDLWFMYFIGVAEVAGGIALNLKTLRKLAAPALTLLMSGAVYTHIAFNEWGMLVVAIMITVASGYFSYKTLPKLSSQKIKTAG